MFPLVLTKAGGALKGGEQIIGRDVAVLVVAPGGTDFGPRPAGGETATPTRSPAIRVPSQTLLQTKFVRFSARRGSGPDVSGRSVLTRGCRRGGEGAPERVWGSGRERDRLSGQCVSLQDAGKKPLSSLSFKRTERLTGGKKVTVRAQDAAKTQRTAAQAVTQEPARGRVSIRTFPFCLFL